MLPTYLHKIRKFFGIVLLLTSCGKQTQSPAPAPSQPVTDTIQSIKREFQQGQYDQRLAQLLRGNSSTNKAWTWLPQWTNASQRQLGDSATYVYVPLAPMLPGLRQPITLLQARRYLLVKRTPREVRYSIVSYFWEASTTTQPTEPAPEFFTTFSGRVYIQELTANQQTQLLYQNGLPQSPIKRAAQQKGMATTEIVCHTEYTCYWTLYCRQQNNSGPGPVVYGRMTQGTDYCAQPQDYTLSYGSDCFWQKTDQTTLTSCTDSGPSNPTQPDPGPGPTGPSYPTGPTGPTGVTTGSTTEGRYVIIYDNVPSQAPPADCGSWRFQRVGPSGYMACGISDVRFDILSTFNDGSGRTRLEYFNYGFESYNLYFEMPPVYSPGQAATLCAQLKDQAEQHVENLYGGGAIPAANADVVANEFYSYLASLMQSVGGRLAKRANYPNTPVSSYSETLFPNNGGCS